jgi:hypothetical protein
MMKLEKIINIIWEYSSKLLYLIESALLEILVIATLATKVVKSCQKLASSLGFKKKSLMCVFLTTERSTLKSCLVA